MGFLCKWNTRLCTKGVSFIESSLHMILNLLWCLHSILISPSRPSPWCSHAEMPLLAICWKACISNWLHDSCWRNLHISITQAMSRSNARYQAIYPWLMVLCLSSINLNATSWAWCTETWSFETLVREYPTVKLYQARTRAIEGKVNCFSNIAMFKL